MLQELTIPAYLYSINDEFIKNPRQANLDWFRNARYGLFLHYGLFSLLGRHEWVQFKEKIMVAEYAELKDRFTAENFNAEKIVQFARDCGMKYINFTTRHHESFCLWDTKYTPFNSVNSPARRDLVKELYDACEDAGMALFLYYSHGRDWKHSHAPNNDEWGGSARPEYDVPEPSYKYGAEHDLNIYIEFMKNQITELLEKFPNVAGIWLDGIAVPLSGDYKKFKCDELYAKIRSISSHALVSYKQGLLGTEDFFAPEHRPEGVKDRGGKTLEICTTMIKEPLSWGYYKGAVHRSKDEVLKTIENAGTANANLLLNIGLLPDGSLDPEDAGVLRRAAVELS